MSNQLKIKSLFKEAEIYQNQGLLTQSREKYLKALQLVRETRATSNHQQLVDGIKERIRTVEKHMAEIDEANETPELSKEVQNLIRDSFSFSIDKEAAAIEGAAALVEFGQVEQALTEFRRLLKEGCLPLLAAKNVIRCLLALSSPDGAIEEFKRWVSEDTFSKPDLICLRAFLENAFEERGVNAELPELGRTPSAICSVEEEEEDPLRISSVIVRLENGISKCKLAEFEVTLHSDSIVNVIVSAEQKELVKAFRPGIRLSDMQFFSPMGLFRSSGMISAMRKISRGPKQGGYLLDISIEEGLS